MFIDNCLPKSYNGEDYFEGKSYIVRWNGLFIFKALLKFAWMSIKMHGAEGKALSHACKISAFMSGFESTCPYMKWQRGILRNKK